MGERQTTSSEDSLDDLFEPALGDFADDDLALSMPFSSEKQRLAAMRRRAERRLEEKRLREELGDYDLELSSYQVQLIWKRITDERFKLNSAGPALRGFILDFQAATGKHFEDEDPS